MKMKMMIKTQNDNEYWDHDDENISDYNNDGEDNNDDGNDDENNADNNYSNANDQQ